MKDAATYTQDDAERAIQTALAAFRVRPPNPAQLVQVGDAIDAFVAKDYGIAFVLALGAVLDTPSQQMHSADVARCERLQHSFESARSVLNLRYVD